MPRPESLSIVVLPIDRAFDILRKEWETDSIDATDDPTLSVDYLEIWWRYFGKPGNESVLAFVTPAKAVVGLLFTRLETEQYYRLPVRVVRCWVNGHAQRAGLFLRCDADAAARAVADYWAMNGRRWDLLRLQGLPAGEFADALLRHARALRCRGVVARSWAHSMIDIHEPWEAHLRGVVSSDTRREVERQGRRLAQLAAVSFATHDSVEAVSAGMADLMKIELQSWKNDSGEILASRPALAGFYQDVATVFAAKGKAVVATLRLGDVPICAVLELRCERRLLTLKTSFDERYAKYSPGSQLFKYLIEQAFRQGFKEFDFYGMMAFSRRWAKLDRRFVDLEIEGSTLRSRSVGMVKTARNWWRSRRQDHHMA